MKKSGVLKLYKELNGPEDTRSHGDVSVISALVQRVLTFDPTIDPVPDVLDTVTITLKQWIFLAESLHALLVALQNLPYRIGSQMCASDLGVLQTIEDLVESNIMRSIHYQVRDGVCALRSENSEKVKQGITLYVEWFLPMYQRYSLSHIYFRAWHESLVFALYNSLSITPIEEKERIFTIMEEYLDEYERKVFLLSYAGNCKIDAIPWLEEYFKHSKFEQIETFRLQFYKNIAWNKNLLTSIHSHQKIWSESLNTT